MKDQNIRALFALSKRNLAADIANNRNPNLIKHKDNGDEEKYANQSYLMSFTKGLEHDPVTGLVKDPTHFKKLVTAIDTGKPEDFKQIPIASSVNKFRAWESAGAGLTFDLEGPDAQSVTMPPAPKLGSEELVAEIAEVYAQALLRDVDFHSMQSNSLYTKLVDLLIKLDYFVGNGRNDKPLTYENAFRGFTPGDLKGEYISQFLLAGNKGKTDLGDHRLPKNGFITYGSLTIDQRVRKPKEKEDYLTNWGDWLNIQNGEDVSKTGPLYTGRSFITTPRDLSEYVHFDALYEAYLNACLLLLDMDAKVSATNRKDVPKYDFGVPFRDPDNEDHQQGFAHYGGPHILSLVTEVATRALKAVRYQKFNIHRRMRPEVLAARLEALRLGNLPNAPQELTDMANKLTDVLKEVKKITGNHLLPMAFPEGSPMHPAYGAGHATVAGACVTVLKAFFNTDLYIRIDKEGTIFELVEKKPTISCAFYGNNEKLEINEVSAFTVEDELNKLAANISIGRDWAGVHYYSDYVKSLTMGEEIAIGILQEQSICYNPLEDFSLTLSKFDGTKVKIKDGYVNSIS